LISWAQKVRDSFKVNATTEVVTTRRLVHICKSYDMYGKDRKKAIAKCISRFQGHVQTSFLDLYKLIDEDWDKKEDEEKRLKDGVDPETPF